MHRKMDRDQPDRRSNGRRCYFYAVFGPVLPRLRLRRPAGTRDVVAAAQLGPDGTVTTPAHAVVDVGPATAHHGVTFCGLVAAAEVVVLPALPWEQVPKDERCTTCHRAAAPLEAV